MTITITSDGPQTPFTISSGPERVYCPMCIFADDDECGGEVDESAFREIEWVEGVGFVYKEKG